MDPVIFSYTLLFYISINQVNFYCYANTDCNILGQIIKLISMLKRTGIFRHQSSPNSPEIKILTKTTLDMHQIFKHFPASSQPSSYEKKHSYKEALYYNHLARTLETPLFKAQLILWLRDHPFYSEAQFLNGQKKK